MEDLKIHISKDVKNKLPKDYQFRRVIDFPDYVVDTMGNIYSMKTKRLMKPRKCKKGYMRITLSFLGMNKSKAVHRIVLETFTGKHDDLQVNHKHGIKSDNRLSELEWATQSENINHAYETGLNNWQIPIEQIDIKTGEVVNVFRSSAHAERETGIDRDSIRDVCKSKKHCHSAGGYFWRNQGSTNTYTKPKNKKSVLKIDKNTGEILDRYETLCQASETNGIAISQISMCCNGKYKTAGGYKWSFEMVGDENGKAESK